MNNKKKMSKKKKTILLLIVLIILLVALAFEIIILFPKDIKNNNIGNTNSDNENIYDKYKDIKWADEVVLVDYLYGSIEIVDGKLECEPITQNYCDMTQIDGRYKKILFYKTYDENYTLYANILTEDGRAFIVGYPNEIGNEVKVRQILESYNVIDMTIPYENYRKATTNDDIGWTYNKKLESYFLTSSGKLLSEDNRTFETDNQKFVGTNCFLYDSDHTVMLCLYYDEENHISYKEEKRLPSEDTYKFTSNYKSIKNNSGTEMVAKYIYDEYDSNRKIIIIDENDGLYLIEYINESFSIRYVGKVTSTVYTPTQSNFKPVSEITFKLSDGDEYKFLSETNSYFDIFNKEEIKFTES